MVNETQVLSGQGTGILAWNKVQRAVPTGVVSGPYQPGKIVRVVENGVSGRVDLVQISLFQQLPWGASFFFTSCVPGLRHVSLRCRGWGVGAGGLGEALRVIPFPPDPLV